MMPQTALSGLPFVIPGETVDLRARLRFFVAAENKLRDGFRPKADDSSQSGIRRPLKSCLNAT